VINPTLFSKLQHRTLPLHYAGSVALKSDTSQSFHRSVPEAERHAEHAASAASRALALKWLAGGTSARRPGGPRKRELQGKGRDGDAGAAGRRRSGRGRRPHLRGAWVWATRPMGTASTRSTCTTTRSVSPEVPARRAFL